MTDEHERSQALKAIDDLRRELNSDRRPGNRAQLTPARPQARNSSASPGSDRPNLYYVREIERRSGVEERTKPLQQTTQKLIAKCRTKEFWDIYYREADLLGFVQNHPLCKNHEFCGRYVEIHSVESPDKIRYRSHCCISCRDSKGLADFAMGCLLYTSPSPRDGLLSRMPSSA